MKQDAFPFPYQVDERTRERAAMVRLVLLDVDGVLTDGRLPLGNDGMELKEFHIRDGHGIKMLQETGVEVGIISGRSSSIVERRAGELGIKHVYQGCQDKLATVEDLLHRLNQRLTETAFVGDDVVDLPIMLRAGLAVAVNDAHHVVKHYAHWITPSSGGMGAVRELCDMVMYAQGKYAAMIHRYL
ncbi:MAG: KdsC family phosphatase [Acidiferrobacterales bacterium]